MVDALRYELGVALEKLLSEDGPIELHAAFAQLPTITLVGMASLLPGARTDLSLTMEGENLVPGWQARRWRTWRSEWTCCASATEIDSPR